MKAKKLLYLTCIPLPYVSRVLKLLLDLRIDIHNEPNVPIVVEHDQEKNSVSHVRIRLEHLEKFQYRKFEY